VNVVFGGVVNNANSSGVVNVYGSWWLWMTKFFKDKSDDFGLLCIEEERAKLRVRISFVDISMMVTYYLSS
jgi:hypothetical protein